MNQADPSDQSPGRVSILGCGWLGLPLGRRLVESGFLVKGSTTDPGKLPLLDAAGIEPFLLLLDPEIQGDLPSKFFQTDILLINIPPGRGREDVEAYHPGQIRALIPAIIETRIPFVIYVSSTSVYPNVGGIVREEDAGSPPTASGRALLEAESLLQSHAEFATTVVRFGGLIGGDRHPARFLAGKSNVADADAPVNLIHQEDCLRILTRLIEGGPRRDVFNACADAHPTRRDFYTHEARKFQLPVPLFSNARTSPSKIVNSEKLKRTLNYQFVYPDPSDAFPAG